MNLFDKIKSLSLAVLILVGGSLYYGPARAADLQPLTVAGGCFWCVEADFEKVSGVSDVVSGFAGGQVANPSYREVSKGGTGHYEAVRITFDPSIVTRERLLHLFLRSIDPTDAGGQFCDRGNSYRTAIFASGETEENLARRALEKAEADLGQAVVTPVLPATTFYEADASHQDYYRSTSLIITRFGPRTRAQAYKLYREACGRDQRVRALWGSAAPFAGS